MNTTTLVFTVLLISATVFALYEGDDCTVNDRTAQPGKCIRLQKCEYAKGLLQIVKRPQTCGFVGLSPLVCCPLSKAEPNKGGDECKPVARDNSFPPQNGQCVESSRCDYKKALNLIGKAVDNCKSGESDSLICCPSGALKKHTTFESIAEKKCFDYYDKEKFVVGVSNGEKATTKEFPHMAAIGFKENNNSVEWVCGGSLISEYYVLTAAHCADSRGLVPNVIRLGDLDLENSTDDASPVDFSIDKITVHPDYKFSSHYHDIALFKLSRPQYMDPYIKPACLHTRQNLPFKLQATGWGRIEFNGPVSSHLMKVFLKVSDITSCNAIYNRTLLRKLKNGILGDVQICAVGETTEDTCPGDSGGPLHFLKDEDAKFKEHFVVAGITSFGKGCGFETTPGVYTRVLKYVPWIESIVWPSESLEA